MKKTILLSSILAVGAAFAVATGTDVESGNAIGALDVTIADATSQKQKLIAVPFLGYSAETVSVQDMVKTSDLADDSKLYVPNTDGDYDTFKLTDGKWVADQKVSVGSQGQIGTGTSIDQSTATVKRGDAFWIEPIFKNKATTGTIFLLGESGAGKGETQISAGWNLVGNASTEKVSLKGLEATTGDQIIVQVDGTLRYYTYKDGKGWRFSKNLKWSNPDTDPLEIEAGQGFWFKSAAGMTIDWNTGKVKAVPAT